MIRSKPSTAEYRDAWERNFGKRDEPNHSALAVKHFEPLLGYCVCEHCARLPSSDPAPSAAPDE